MAVITVRPATISPVVTFERRFYGENDAEQVKQVVDTWTDVTGLNFNAMPREWKIIDSAGELYVWVSVAHPLNNRSDIVMFWPKETN